MTLEEMGIEVKGAAATIRGFKELLRGIDTEESLDDPITEINFLLILHKFNYCFYIYTTRK